ncbi:hypothetical protein ACJMK2_038978 [Sinanodonta woodiana]|uniref:Glycosyltransferase 61 catalytic domain-containing protein n=1 Tax=Sinanodonta woodiana TaxID=1069815 RepID=A0ABD3WDT7_SINWO
MRSERRWRFAVIKNILFVLITLSLTISIVFLHIIDTGNGYTKQTSDMGLFGGESRKETSVNTSLVQGEDIRTSDLYMNEKAVDDILNLNVIVSVKTKTSKFVDTFLRSNASEYVQAAHAALWPNYMGHTIKHLEEGLQAMVQTNMVDNTKLIARQMHANQTNGKWREQVAIPIARRLLPKRKTFCSGNFVGYGHLFAELHNVLVNPAFAVGKAGGENVREVLNQSVEEELYALKPGYFTIKCNQTFKYRFSFKLYLSNWTKVLQITSKNYPDHDTRERFTIAITRIEYANLYFTILDLYNVFLMTRLFVKHPNETDILLIDGHPSGKTDSVWYTTFAQVIRAGSLTKPTVYRNMVWAMPGTLSDLSRFQAEPPPFLEQFRDFVLTSHGVVYKTRTLNCSSLSIGLIWRRDYLAHPRNPNGVVKRKIKNEKELLDSLRISFPVDRVNGVQLDIFNMSEQLKWISDIDILVAMHGAGLAHVAFAQPYSGLIELYPMTKITASHFNQFCKWRGIKYFGWRNSNKSLELPGFYTVVRPKVVVDLVSKMKVKLCKRTNNV